MAIYIGIVIGAFNMIFYFPYVFPDEPEVLGLVQLLLAYSIVVGSFIGAGFPNGVLYFFPKLNTQQRESLFGLALLVSAVLLVLGGIILVFFPDEVSNLITKDGKNSRPYLSQLFLLTLFYVVFELLAGMMQSCRVVIFPAFMKEVGRKVSVTLLLLFTQLNWIMTTHQFISALVCLYALIIIWLSFKFYKTIGLKFSFRFSSINLKEIKKYNSTTFLSNIIQILVVRIDIIMLASMMPSTSYAAYYAIAFQIGSVVWTPVKSINRAVNPILSEYLANRDYNKVKKIFFQSLKNQFLISSFIFCMIFANLDLFFQIIPEKYAEGKDITWIIAIGYLVNASFGPNGFLILYSENYRFDLYLNGLKLIIIVLLNLIFIPSFGIFGAALSSTLVVVLENIVKGIILYKYYKINSIIRESLIIWVLIFFLLLVSVLFPGGYVLGESLIMSFVISLAYVLLIVKTNIFKDVRDAISMIPVLRKVFKF